MKNLMTMDRLDAETALELPNREMLLVTIVITNLLNNLDIDVNVVNNKVAVQVCAIVEVIDTDLLGGGVLDCDIRQ
jgi:hypothetical protein